MRSNRSLDSSGWTLCGDWTVRQAAASARSAAAAASSPRSRASRKAAASASPAPVTSLTAMSGGARAMQRLKEEGIVGAIGLGVNEWQVCAEALEHHVVLTYGDHRGALAALAERMGLPVLVLS